MPPRHSFNYTLSHAELPFPALRIEVSDPRTGGKEILLGKIDTGAGGSVIPVDLVAKWHLHVYSDTVAISLGDVQTEQPTYLVRFYRKDLIDKEVEIIAVKRRDNSVLIGRDILNNFKLIADGPSLRLSLEGSFTDR